MSNYPDDMNWAAFDAANTSPPIPNKDAYAAAAKVELARLLGIDWQEADDVLDMHCADDDEKEEALAHYRGNISRVMATLLFDAAEYAQQCKKERSLKK